MCTTNSDGYVIDITPEDKGFHQSDKRNFVLNILSEGKPKNIQINGKDAIYVEEAKMDVEKDVKSIQWTWSEAGSKIIVKVPDTRKKLSININNK